MTIRVFTAFTAFFALANATERSQPPTIRSTYIGIENIDGPICLTFTETQDVVEIMCDDDAIRIAYRQLNEFYASMIEPLIMPYCTIDTTAFGFITCIGEFADAEKYDYIDYGEETLCLNGFNVGIGDDWGEDSCIPMLQ